MVILVTTLAAMWTGCLREPPTTSCIERGDCYLGEQCINYTCTSVAMSPDMHNARDMLVVPEINDAALDMPQVDLYTTDLADLDMPVPDQDSSDPDMPDMSDMPDRIDMSHMSTDAIIDDAHLPGPRASLIAPNQQSPLVLAYLPNTQGGTLMLYKLGPENQWVGIEVASELNWPITDQTENAALFERVQQPRIIYEVHKADAGISLRTVIIDLPTWALSNDTQVLPPQNIPELHFDVLTTGTETHALVTLANRLEHISEQDNGSWFSEGSYPGTFTRPRFVVDEAHVCGLVQDNTLRCFAEDAPTTVKIDELFVDEFDVSRDSNTTFVLMRQGDRLAHGEIEDKKNGMPSGRGLRWVDNVMTSDLPPGDRLSLSRPDPTLTYRSASGSVYSQNPAMRNVMAIPMRHDNTVTTSCTHGMTLHIFGSPASGEPNEHIFYETHTLP